MPFNRGEYPRLYFSGEDLPALRANAQSGFAAYALGQLLHRCRRLLNPTDPWYFDFQERQSDTWRTRAGRWMVEPALASLSMAYAITGDARYGLAARDAVLTIITKKLADVPHTMAGYGPTGGWRHAGGHDKAMYAWAISHVFDMCHDLFTAEQAALFIEHVQENIAIAETPEVFCRDARDWMNNRGARAAVCCFGIYSLLLQGEAGVRTERLDLAQHVAETFLYTSMDQDGMPYEGYSYGTTLGTIAEFAWMLKRSGGPDLLRNRRFGQYLQTLVHALLPVDEVDVEPFNDCHKDTVSAGVALLLPRDTPGHEVWPWLLRQLDMHPRRLARVESDESVYDTTFAIHTATFMKYVLLNWQGDGDAIRTPQELGYPLSRFFPGIGLAMMRTGWGQDDYLLSHICGYKMIGEHRQSDFNHLSLHALGEHFLVDEGYGQVTVDQGLPEHYRYYGRADVHNTVVFDGQDQLGNHARVRYFAWGEGRLLDCQSTPAYDTALGDAASAYGPDHTINRALRRVVLVKQARNPFVVVIDTMQVDATGSSHDFVALWRTAAGNQIRIADSAFTIVGRQNVCVGRVAWPPDARLLAVEHYGQAQMQVHQRASVLEMVTVFMPLRRGDATPAIAVERRVNGSFAVAVTEGRRRHLVQAGTVLTGPLQTPASVRYRAE